MNAIVGVRSLPVSIRRQIPKAMLPENYEAAKRALEECERIDQCKDWADKSAGLLSYAKQLKDHTLEEHVHRIRVRAQVRLGEMFLAMPRANPVSNGKGGGRGARPNPESRLQVASSLGIGKGMLGLFMSLARVPKEQRERLIDQSPPVTAKQLRIMGSGTRPWNLGLGVVYKTIMQDPYGPSAFLRWISRNGAADLASQLSVDEADRLRPLMIQISDWADEFERHLPKERK